MPSPTGAAPPVCDEAAGGVGGTVTVTDTAAEPPEVVEGAAGGCAAAEPISGAGAAVLAVSPAWLVLGEVGMALAAGAVGWADAPAPPLGGCCCADDGSAASSTSREAAIRGRDVRIVALLVRAGFPLELGTL